MPRRASFIEVNFDVPSILAELSEGAEEKKHPFRWPVLTTTGADSRPEARIVVLRAFDGDCAFVYSDKRTGKVAQIQTQAAASLLFFDADRKLQIRAKGTAFLHIADALAREHWKQLPQARHIDYQSREAPGTTWTAASASIDSDQGEQNFTVVRIAVASLDVLQLSREEHRRYHYRRCGGDWERERVVP
jgi:pyridoxine/pyridoxamine 5'-phosphate oxidase